MARKRSRRSTACWASSAGALALGDVGGDARPRRRSRPGRRAGGTAWSGRCAPRPRPSTISSTLDGLAAAPAPGARSARRPSASASGQQVVVGLADQLVAGHAPAPPRTAARPAGSGPLGSLTQMKAGRVVEDGPDLLVLAGAAPVSATCESWTSTTWPTHSRTRSPTRPAAAPPAPRSSGSRRRPGSRCGPRPRTAGGSSPPPCQAARTRVAVVGVDGRQPALAPVRLPAVAGVGLPLGLGDGEAAPRRRRSRGWR